MRKIKKSFLWPFLLFFLAPAVKAHCPLCTMGAAAVGGALYLGISTIVVGFFIGAFAVSTGWWVSQIIKKQYFPCQKWLLIISSFILTIIPMMFLFGQHRWWNNSIEYSLAQ